MFSKSSKFDKESKRQTVNIQKKLDFSMLAKTDGSKNMTERQEYISTNGISNYSDHASQISTMQFEKYIGQMNEL